MIKLLDRKILFEVSRSEVTCVNPLIAAIRIGKKILCIDLSRHMNPKTNVRKFTIESTMKFLSTVSQDDWMWLFDLKAAHHQLPIYKGH